jgi:hypothetical protein
MVFDRLPLIEDEATTFAETAYRHLRWSDTFGEAKLVSETGHRSCTFDFSEGLFSEAVQWSDTRGASVAFGKKGKKESTWCLFKKEEVYSGKKGVLQDGGLYKAL